MMTTLWHC